MDDKELLALLQGILAKMRNERAGQPEAMGNLEGFLQAIGMRQPPTVGEGQDRRNLTRPVMFRVPAEAARSAGMGRARAWSRGAEGGNTGVVMIDEDELQDLALAVAERLRAARR